MLGNLLDHCQCTNAMQFCLPIPFSYTTTNALKERKIKSISYLYCISFQYSKRLFSPPSLMLSLPIACREIVMLDIQHHSFCHWDAFYVRILVLFNAFYSSDFVDRGNRVMSQFFVRHSFVYECFILLDIFLPLYTNVNIVGIVF